MFGTGTDNISGSRIKEKVEMSMESYNSNSNSNYDNNGEEVGNIK